jgi:MoxR-like ATPase
MRERVKYYRAVERNGVLVAIDMYGLQDSGNMSIRSAMIASAYSSGMAMELNLDTGRVKRVSMAEAGFDGYVEEVKPEATKVDMSDPVLAFINKSVDLKPKTLVMSDLKWKYLVRSAMRGKNIMMTGDSGCGKTFAAQQLVAALERPEFSFNLGATQDPRGTLIGNTHFEKDSGTVFHESTFVKAIQTENAVILLDEISRAHPEAWNILMTVLDYGQRYLRLDEHPDAPIVKVADGVTFIATANIGNEYTATRAMDRALVDRFVIMEMESLDAQKEAALLQQLNPGLSADDADAITNIADATRKEKASDGARLTNAISTRLAVEMAGLIVDGFTIAESAEVCVYPFFDADGGMDSERTFVKQIVQKYAGDKEDANIFGTAPVDTDGHNPF